MNKRQEGISPSRRWPGRLLAGGGGLMLALILIGIAYQQIGTQKVARTLPPPGQLVDVGGFQMHIQCEGEGNPTVILEGGNSGYSASWAWILPDLAQTTRVCAYDRAGLAWSGSSPNPRDGRTIARELKVLLDGAGEEGPFVLVGHSAGGLYVRNFAYEYPTEVAGLVLLDSSHPDQFDRMPEALQRQMRWGLRLMAAAPMLAHIGLVRATNVFAAMAQGLPEEDYRSAMVFGASPRHLRTSYRELAMWEETAAQMNAAGTHGDLPLLVLSATEVGPGSQEVVDYMTDLREELAAHSASGEHRFVDGADHLTIITDHELAGRTSGEILAFLTYITTEADDIQNGVTIACSSGAGESGSMQGCCCQ